MSEPAFSKPGVCVVLIIGSVEDTDMLVIDKVEESKRLADEFGKAYGFDPVGFSFRSVELEGMPPQVAISFIVADAVAGALDSMGRAANDSEGTDVRLQDPRRKHHH